jgi:hypothetical protein
MTVIIITSILVVILGLLATYNIWGWNFDLGLNYLTVSIITGGLGFGFIAGSLTEKVVVKEFKDVFVILGQDKNGKKYVKVITSKIETFGEIRLQIFENQEIVDNIYQKNKFGIRTCYNVYGSELSNKRLVKITE